MRTYKFGLTLLGAVALVLVVSPIYSKKTGVGVVRYLNDGMGPVKINFTKHTQAGIKCGDCHHEKNTEGQRCTGCHHRQDATNTSCGTCHTKKEQLKRKEREIIFHLGRDTDGHGGVRHKKYTCGGCHLLRKQQGKKHGPLYEKGKCEGCHSEG